MQNQNTPNYPSSSWGNHHYHPHRLFFFDSIFNALEDGFVDGRTRTEPDRCTLRLAQDTRGCSQSRLFYLLTAIGEIQKRGIRVIRNSWYDALRSYMYIGFGSFLKIFEDQKLTRGSEVNIRIILSSPDGSDEHVSGFYSC
jgi:hypothetical protein